jgi:hypothetical protein
MINSLTTLLRFARDYARVFWLALGYWALDSDPWSEAWDYAKVIVLGWRRAGK